MFPEFHVHGSLLNGSCVLIAEVSRENFEVLTGSMFFKTNYRLIKNNLTQVALDCSAGSMQVACVLYTERMHQTRVSRR